MSSTAIALVLVAAVAHASWNLFSKQAAATGAVCFLWLLAAWATVLYSPLMGYEVLASYQRLTAMNWLFLAGTGFLHCGYFLFLQLGYRIGDLSLAYPIGRGTGATIAAVAGIVLLGERPGWVTIAGIVTIIAGVIVIGLPARQATESAAPAPGTASQRPTASQRRTSLAVIGFASATGVFIASYTIWDKYAVATLRTPATLQGCVEFPAMALVFAPFVLRDAKRLAGVWHAFRPQVLSAAVLSPLAYILVLVALSFTAVSAVAPAREVSVLFGVLLGRRLLGEGNVARRLAAGVAIVAGIIAIAVG